MGNTTTDLLIWTPDESDTSKPNVYLATMAQSLEDGAGERLRKQEQFIGCNMSLASAMTLDSNTRQIPFAITTANATDFNEGMTISGGSVSVPVNGFYQVNYFASFQPQTSAIPRVNNYLYRNGTSIKFSSTFGVANSTTRYFNASISVVLNLTTGDDLTIKSNSLDALSTMSAGAGSGFSVVLIKPTA